MAEQLLDGADVVAVFEQVGREAVAKLWQPACLWISARVSAFLKARWTGDSLM